MKTPKIYPRAKWILVKPDAEDARENEFGIITPENVEQERRAFGTVMSVGQDIKDVKKGDRVIYGAYAGEKIKLKGSKTDFDFVMLFDEDVIATFEE